ncbi:ribonuclease III [Akkermansiaceae bacterium]|nr:ribonuclease III [Akkermansiaceae bacterium]
MSIEERLGYHFKDPTLLEVALSHPSLSSEMRPAPPDNQRLEFLGDAVLELAVTDFLFQRHPDFQEGVLTKLRASIVSKPALATTAVRFEVGKELKMSNGEEGSGGRKRASNLADAMESLFGAIYLDAGFDEAREIILRLLEPELEQLDPDTAQGNSKGELQEILQKLSPESPSYHITGEEGPPHSRTFVASVRWMGNDLGTGEGPSKKSAETAAASKALKLKLWKKKSS